MTTTTTTTRSIFLTVMAVAVLFFLVISARLSAAEPSQAGQIKRKAMTKTESGLQYADEKEGDGETPQTGQTCIVHYTGWLHDSTKPDAKGNVFDSGTITTRLGAGQVIRGWDQGIPGMRVGGQRRLIIPPELAYGNSTPNPSKIPPNATLIFDVTMNAVQ